MCRHVQLDEGIRAQVAEMFGLVPGKGELTVYRAGRLQRPRLADVPQELMQVPHDGEHLKHLRCAFRCPPPVLTAESDLGDLLPCAETVVDRAAPKALLPQTRRGSRTSWWTTNAVANLGSSTGPCQESPIAADQRPRCCLLYTSDAADE